MLYIYVLIEIATQATNIRPIPEKLIKGCSYCRTVPRNRMQQALRVFEMSDTPISAVFLAQELGITKNAARQLIHRLHKEGYIRKEQRGFYTHVQAVKHEGIQVSAPLRLHGLKIITKERHGLAGVMSQQLLQSAPPTIHRHRINHSLTWSEEWEGRKVTVTIYNNKGAEINLSATDRPLSFPDFTMFCGWILAKAPAGTLEAWELKQVGLNYDIVGARLNGISGITIQAFKNMWMQLYEHNKDVLRVETHINIDISLKEALEILGEAMQKAEEVAKRKVAYKVEQ